MKKFGLKVSKRKIVEFCKRNHIRSLSLFGSILRNDFSRSSDIDMLVEFEIGYVPGFFHLIEIEEELSYVFSGRKVDLRTPNDLSRYFRDDVLAEAEAVYIES
ncbi:nucleotidyltransferase family protein [bacterium]|nr:nucleotidyltransferase family protein [Candidatus Atribacteria bacterium]MBU4361171.1 nucleotidyltransferase family protein [bacterium]MCG2762407.1 nucleotidyltransferase family protein [Candidatus Atribacteria bacterium]MCG2821800.1 nucleotidyltransferase family protein [Candidatus Atribacteria bacterium]